MQLGGALVWWALLLGYTLAQPEANLTVVGDANLYDLFRMNRAPPTVDGCKGGASMNWALDMPVTMSSTLSSSTGGSLATDDDLSLTKCAATRSSNNPWVRIDMGVTRRVGKLILLLPTTAAVNGLQVYVGEDTTNGGTKNALCNTIQTASKPWTVVFCSQAINGRYIFLRLPGASKTIRVCEVNAFPGCLTSGCPNVARGNPAFHSSQCCGGSPNRAVDGKVFTSWGSGSCTHTSSQTNPWWYVDMQQLRVVDRVLVSNRADCCWTRLNGMEVWVGTNKAPPGTAAPNKKCGTLSTVGRGATVTVRCPPSTVGQYVFVRIPGSGKVITLCEVQVFEPCTSQLPCPDAGCKRGQSANVAYGKTAVHSSNYNSQFVAKNAVNGDFRTNIQYCTHTRTETDPWWYVDLGCERTVAKVTVTNRGDCCGSRLNGFKVAVGNDASNGGMGNTPCGSGYTVAQGGTIVVDCPRLKGRYVTVYLKGTNKILQLCEVQVFEPCDRQCYNLALQQPSTKSNGAYLDGATDGNPNTNYWGRSCYLSYTTNNPYFTLDLGHGRQVGKVRLWNRGDCGGCTNGLDNFEVRVGFNSNGQSNPLCHSGNPSRYSVVKGQSVDVVCNTNRLGRYVTVKEYGWRQLGICEMEVYETGTCHDYGCFNVAKNRGASISSLYSGRWPASKAVDGNYWSKNIGSNYCTHSNTQNNPWFRVDLWQEMIVYKVYIANRGDCCGNRLTNFMIRVGSNGANAGNNNPICRQKLPTMAQGGYVAYACPNMMGRYVNLQIIQNNGILNFCELQVCGTLAPNSAVGKPTAQSSTGWNGPALRAVDGDTTNRYSSGSCTHTLAEKNPWWRVDLQQDLIVTSVRVTNRGDCCGSRLYGMEIRVGSSLDFEGNNNQKCTSSTLNIPQGRTWTIMCNNGAGLRGRYLNILLPGDNKVITLCEVMVFTKKDRQCQLSGRRNENCNQPCPAKTGGISCHQCPAGQIGRLRHVASGLCAVPNNNRTYPNYNELIVMSNKCDGIESLFLYSPSKLLYHVASSASVHVLYGGFSAVDGRPLVLWYGHDPNQNRLQYTIDDNHFKNVRTQQCIRVKAHNPSVGDTLNLYKDCTHGASDYEFVIDPSGITKWSLALNVQTDDSKFGYFSDNWANPTYFGDATNLGANAWLPAYDGVLVEKIGIQINGIDRVMELPEEMKGKWTLQDLVLRDGALSYFPAVKSELDPFNFQRSSPPVAYCTALGTNQQILDNQQWHACHSRARIGVPMGNALRTGIFKLQMGSRCIHISGGGFGTPGDNTELVAWSGCTEDRLRFTYRADGSFQHSSGSKCLGLRDATPKKGTRVVIKPCSAATKFTWRSDGVILLQSNTKLCWAIEGNNANPGNGKRIQLSDGCNPKVNAMFQFRMYDGVLNSPCAKPLAVEGIGLYYGCSHKSGSAGRMTWANLVFKPAAVWVYGKPKCNPSTSSGCDARMGFCTCLNGYFGSACEYKCPDGRFGRNCLGGCQCQNGANCSHTNGACACSPGFMGRLCATPCPPNFFGLGCKPCNCSANAVGCDTVTGQCTCPAGYGGKMCNQKCGSGLFAKMWGPGCINKCTCVNGTCDGKTGKCTCDAGYIGIDCNNPCASGVYGVGCTQPCNCFQGSSCDHVTGKCVCKEGYTGADCSKSCDSLHCGQGCTQLCSCGTQGTCDRFKCGCTCNPGYQGSKCDKICDSGFYGKSCEKTCLCHSQATCDPVTGACTCSAGLTGTYCNQMCPNGTWGANCLQLCHCVHGTCDPVDGTCDCDVGYKGNRCDTKCPSGTFGRDCVESCNCSSSVTADVCHYVTGTCLCASGYQGVRCDSSCPIERWGLNCQLQCPCQNSGACDSNSGACICPPGYTGRHCENTCPTGKFGLGCLYACSCLSSNSICSPIDGTCTCHAGYRGHNCDLTCAAGLWGLGCSQTCSCFNGQCNPVTGQCQCSSGWTGTNCDQRCPAGTYGIGCNSKCQCHPTATCDATDGTCGCAGGWQGRYCNLTCPGRFGPHCDHHCPACARLNVIVADECNKDTGACECKAGWRGVLCKDSCPIGYYGDGCQNQCLCKNGGICDHVTGNCSCPLGKMGRYCGSDCPDGWYGENCLYKCQCANSRQACAKITGTCTCRPGWQDDLCTEACDSNKWGQDCVNTCNCKHGDCNPVDGTCSCNDGYMGSDCGTTCNSTTWGPNCQNMCDCEHFEVCHASEGSCQCATGWIGSQCENSCPDGYYGDGCKQVCQCVNGDCDHVSGTCNCTVGYGGDRCQTQCPNNTFGEDCVSVCQCDPGELCDGVTGECYTPVIVSDLQAKQTDDGGLASSDVGVIAGSAVGGSVLIVLMVLVFLYCKKRVDVDKDVAAAYSAQEGDVSFSPMGTLEKESGVRDGFDNPMYDNFKNDMYNDPVKENPTYGSRDDGMEEAIVADTAGDFE